MKVEKHPNFWSLKPCFIVRRLNEYHEINLWMRQNKIGHNLLSSGAGGYVFEITDNLVWFQLRWL